MLLLRFYCVLKNAESNRVSTNSDTGSSNLASERPETAGNLVFRQFVSIVTPKLQNKAPKKNRSQSVDFDEFGCRELESRLRTAGNGREPDYS